jgi:hypothetical protein
VGAKLSAPAQKVSGAHPASYTVDAVLFPGVKVPRRGVNHPPPLTLRLKEEFSYTCAPLHAFIVCYTANVVIFYLSSRFYNDLPILHSPFALSSVDLLLSGGRGVGNKFVNIYV